MLKQEFMTIADMQVQIVRTLDQAYTPTNQLCELMGLNNHQVVAMLSSHEFKDWFLPKEVDVPNKAGALEKVFCIPTRAVSRFVLAVAPKCQEPNANPEAAKRLTKAKELITSLLHDYETRGHLSRAYN